MTGFSGDCVGGIGLVPFEVSLGIPSPMREVPAVGVSSGSVLPEDVGSS